MQHPGARPEFPTWEDFSQTGLFDNVYISGDYICLASCWYQPWDAFCERSTTFLGETFCTHLNCEHDVASDSGDDGNRYSGCHPDENGDRKRGWHKPTCKECQTVFKFACQNNYLTTSSSETEVKKSSSSDKSSSGVQIQAEGFSGNISTVINYFDEPNISAVWKALFFNEIPDDELILETVVNLVVQFEGNSVSDKSAVKAVAKLAGVSESEVVVLQKVSPQEVFSFNRTSVPLTVSFGIVSPDPDNTMANLLLMKDQQFTEAFSRNGNVSYLPNSMSVDVRNVPQSYLNSIELQTEHKEKSLEPFSWMYIGVGLVSAFLVLLSVGAAILVFRRYRAENDFAAPISKDLGKSLSIKDEITAHVDKVEDSI